MTSSFLFLIDSENEHSELMGFLDFAHCPVFQQPEETTFWKLNLLVFSGEGGDTYFIGSLRKS
jgi:hypothetical protein